MRINTIYITVLAILLTATILVSAHTRPTPVEDHLEGMHNSLLASDWEAAKQELSKVEAEWKKRRPWLQLTKSTGTIVEIDRALGRLQAVVQVESQDSAVDQLADLRQMWKDLKE